VKTGFGSSRGAEVCAPAADAIARTMPAASPRAYDLRRFGGKKTRQQDFVSLDMWDLSLGGLLRFTTRSRVLLRHRGQPGQ